MYNLRKTILFGLASILTLSIFITSCQQDSLIPGQSNDLSIEDRGKDPNGPTLVPAGVSHSRKAIDNFIMSQTNDGQEFFDWADAPDNMVHSAIMLTDSIVSVAYVTGKYKSIEAFFTDAAKNHYKSNTKLPSKWIDQREQLINQVLNLEKGFQGKPGLTAKDILPFGRDDVLPHIYIRITDLKTIKNLRNNKFVVNVEPALYLPVDHAKDYKSSFGCQEGAADNAIPMSDYLDSGNWGLHGSKVSWNYPYNGITQAWETQISAPGKSAGEGIGICVIDTGLSDEQDNLNSEFQSGDSAGRNFIGAFSTLRKFWPWQGYFSPDDNCGHGTAMAGVATAPLAADGNSVGVAYRADLMTIKATNDVIIFSLREVQGVGLAITRAGVHADVNIISMSLGMIPPMQNQFITLSAIFTSIGRGKLIFAAAGTTIKNGPVIFPANLDYPITVAVTGVNTDHNFLGLTKSCNDCHAGPRVDFAVVMEKGSDTGPITTPMTPHSTYPNRPKYTGGSSCATSTAAGIAALVWAAHPNENKYQIYNRLKNNTSPYYNTNPLLHGHGVLYADWAIDN